MSRVGSMSGPDPGPRFGCFRSPEERRGRGAMGPESEAKIPLTAKQSHDDINRAGDRTANGAAAGI